MDFEGTESQVRKQVDEMLGRPLTDDEWEALKQAQAQGAAKGGSGAKAGRSKSASGRASSFARSVGSWVVFLIVAFLVGAAFMGLFAGLAWAFGSTPDWGVSGVWQFVTFAVVFGIIFGLPVVGLFRGYPVATSLIVGSVIVVALVVLAIRMIVRAA